MDLKIIIILSILIFLVYLIYRYTKELQHDSIIMLNAPPGRGKTSTGLYTAICTLKKNVRKFKIKNFFRKIFRKSLNKEMPHLYCNMPLYNVPYKEFRLEHLTREARFEYKSVIFLNEVTLIADSMLAYNIGKDEARKRVNEQLQMFAKLIRQELKSSEICLIIDTQNPNDNAMAFDRCINETQYIMKAISWVPFIRLVKIKTLLINMPDTVNAIEDYDNDNSKWVIVPKSIFKKYNSYCYEMLSRDKPIIGETIYVKERNKRKLLKLMNETTFYIPTFTNHKELIEWNKKYLLLQEQKLKEKEGVTYGKKE